jgi:TRAP-type mannitol/chloroaromatic compound transport system substrate-binding protein
MMLSEFEAKNLEALRTLQTKYKVETREFPKEVIKTLHQYTRTVMKELSAKDKQFKKVHDAYEAFRSNNDAWNSISEAAYAKARKL